MHISDVALVGCGKDKQPGTHRARNLYTGNLFRAALAHAERHHPFVYILSAKHGLVHPDEVLATYDRSMADLTPAMRLAWGDYVVMQLETALFHQPARFTIYAGAPYVEALVESPRFRLHRDWSWEDPLRGLMVGERLRWFKQRRAV